MVEKQLGEKLQAIFKLKKHSFDDPGEAAEQECVFINVEKVTPSVKDQSIAQRIEGSGAIFGNNLKLPIGYILKSIQEADNVLTKDFHFYDLESNTRRFKDKVQRGFSFVYFYRAQYDPNKGEIDEINFTTQET